MKPIVLDKPADSDTEQRKRDSEFDDYGSDDEGDDDDTNIWQSSAFVLGKKLN